MGMVASALAGKEWKLGPATTDRVFTTACSCSTIGGQYQTPIDL